MACNRLAGAASFEPGLASETGLCSALRQEGINGLNLTIRDWPVIIRAKIGLPQRAG
ncbi:MAG: hypothetical protein DDT32_01581 [Syntrophomonadaceae bacterium]|nr:hypothetical protein [Bacillota bacterium]MBT9147815.1 hypothetical protein [Bacillota bacterium]